MEKDLVIGIDGGTGGVRAFVFDREGKIAGKGEFSYETQYPQPGWAEQIPAHWLEGVEKSVRMAMEGIDPSRIGALCAATTSCTVVCCDPEGKELAPAILWMDVRAAEESRKIQEKTGQALSAELFLCKALWLKENQPELYQKTQVLCEYQDYLNHFLTGEWSFSVNTACNWGYNQRKGGFDQRFYEAIGLADALAKVPGKAIPVGKPAGYLREEAAARLGLLPGTLVVQGGIDSSVGMLGMGAVRPGMVALMTGSSNLAMAATEKPLFLSEDAVNSGPDFLLEGYYTSVQGQAASGSILKWFRREFCRDMGEDAFIRLDEQAKEVPPGSDGILVLDHWQGNRTPYNDPSSKGVILGLTMNSTRTQIFRGIMEGVAFGTHQLLEAFGQKGQPVTGVHISGGTTRSKLFLQIHADVSGIPFRVTSDYSVALGAAIACAYGLGWYPSLAQAADGMVEYQQTVLPNPECHQVYEEIWKRYQRLYPALKEQKLF